MLSKWKFIWKSFWIQGVRKEEETRGRRIMWRKHLCQGCFTSWWKHFMFPNIFFLSLFLSLFPSSFLSKRVNEIFRVSQTHSNYKTEKMMENVEVEFSFSSRFLFKYWITKMFPSWLSFYWNERVCCLQQFLQNWILFKLSPFHAN